jgi:hypothetical protein
LVRKVYPPLSAKDIDTERPAGRFVVSIHNYGVAHWPSVAAGAG